MHLDCYEKLQETQICPVSFHLQSKTFCMLYSEPLVFTSSFIFCGKAYRPPSNCNLLSLASCYDLYSIYTVIQMKVFSDFTSDTVRLTAFLLLYLLLMFLHKISKRKKKKPPLKISVRLKKSDSYSVVGLL